MHWRAVVTYIQKSPLSKNSEGDFVISLNDSSNLVKDLKFQRRIKTSTYLCAILKKIRFDFLISTIKYSKYSKKFQLPYSKIICK